MRSNSTRLSGEVLLRPMQDADLAAVRQIDALVYRDLWSPEFVIRQLCDPSRWVHLVAERDGRILGHGAFTIAAGEAHITTVAVAVKEQGRGVRRRLVAALCREAVRRELEAMTLEVRVSNCRAVDLYRRFGFAPTGVRPAYYSPSHGSSEREDGLVMGAHDIGESAFMERVCAAEIEGK